MIKCFLCHKPFREGEGFWWLLFDRKLEPWHVCRECDEQSKRVGGRGGIRDSDFATQMPLTNAQTLE